MTLIRDVLQLPSQVRKSDLVLVLAEGIRKADDYVATAVIDARELQDSNQSERASPSS